MSISSSSMDERKKPPDDDDAGAAVPILSVPVPSTTKPPSDVKSAGDGDVPKAAKKPRAAPKPREGQKIPGVGEVKVGGTADVTQVFPLGHQARQVLRDARARVAEATADEAPFPTATHAEIKLERDGKLDSNVAATLKRVAQLLPMAVECLNLFHEGIEKLTTDEFDRLAALQGDAAAAVDPDLRRHLDLLFTASPSSDSQAPGATVARKSSGNTYNRGIMMALQKATGQPTGFWPALFAVMRPATIGTNVDGARSTNGVLGQFASDKRATSRTATLRGVGVLARAIAKALVPHKCVSMFVDALRGVFRKDAALAELQRLLIGDKSKLITTTVNGATVVVVPDKNKKRSSYKQLAKFDLRPLFAVRSELKRLFTFPLAATDAFQEVP